MKIAFPLIAALAAASPCLADDLPKIDVVIETLFVAAQRRAGLPCDQRMSGVGAMPDRRDRYPRPGPRRPRRQGHLLSNTTAKSRKSHAIAGNRRGGQHSHPALPDTRSCGFEWRAHMDRSLFPRRGKLAEDRHPRSRLSQSANVKIRGR